MIEKIEALRKEPRHVRNRYAFAIALSVTAAIAIMWAVTLPSRFAPEEEAAQPAENSGSSFMRELSGIARSIHESFSGLTVENSASSTPQKDDAIDFRSYLASSTSAEPATAQETASSTATSSHASTTEKSR
jgi:hypothetical protein